MSPDLDQTIAILAQLEAAASARKLPAVLDSLARVAGALAPSDPLRTLGELLVAAIRLDLAFIERHPELLFQCVYNRLYWHDSPAADAFRVGRPAHFGPRVASEFAEQWLEERRARSPGFIWVRSLRPPENGLRGPLALDLRAHHGNVAAVSLEDGDRRLVVTRRHIEEQGDNRPRRLRATRARWDLTTSAMVDELPCDVPEPHVSPDGRFRVRHEAWGACELVNNRTGKVLGPLPIDDIDEGGSVNDVVFANDGRTVVVAGTGDEYSHGFVRSFDVAKRSLIRRWQTARPVWHAAIAKDGQSIAASTSDAVHVWSSSSGAERTCLAMKSAVVGLSQDGARLITANPDVISVWSVGSAPVRLWAERARRGLTPGPRSHSAAAFSPSGERLVTGVLLCDGQSGALIRELDFELPQWLEGGPPENSVLVGDTRIVSLVRGVEVWDAKSGERVVQDGGRRYTHWHVVAFGPEGRFYAVAGAGSNHGLTGERAGGAVIIVDTDTGKVLDSFGSKRAEALAISADGVLIAVGWEDRSVEVWSLPGGSRLVASMSGHKTAVRGMAFSSDNRRVVSAGDDEALRVWDAATGAEVASRPLDARDLTYTSHRNGVTTAHHHWRATEEALAMLDGWGGFVWAERSTVSIRYREAETEILQTETGQVIGWLPGRERVALRRVGGRDVIAGGPVHAVIERGDSTRQTR